MISVSLPTLILVLVVRMMLTVIMLIMCVMSLQLITVIIKYLKQPDELRSVRERERDQTMWLRSRSGDRHGDVRAGRLRSPAKRGPAGAVAPDPTSTKMRALCLQIAAVSPGSSGILGRPLVSSSFSIFIFNFQCLVTCPVSVYLTTEATTQLYG